MHKLNEKLKFFQFCSVFAVAHCYVSFAATIFVDSYRLLTARFSICEVCFGEELLYPALFQCRLPEKPIIVKALTTPRQLRC